MKKNVRLVNTVINGRLQQERLSRMFGAPVYKQRKDKIDFETLEEIQDELLAKGIFSEIEESPSRYYLKILPGTSLQKRPRYWVHFVLFLFTVLTTTMTGALLRGKDPFVSWSNFAIGLPYSFALLTILFSHEMGHYLTARYYKIEATLPYFIPFFVPAFHPGTLGAFIKLRSPMPHKKALFDVGVAGPLAGFVMSIIFLIIGFYRLPDTTGIYAYIEKIHPLGDAHGIDLFLGKTLLYEWLGKLFGAERLPMDEMYHFPFIFAAWFGLLVTAINLMPIGQLDGGHITYALFGAKARYIAILAFFLLIVLNFYLISNFNSYIWVLWTVLLLIFIRFRHPPTLDDSQNIDRKRRILGLLSYVIFIVCFSPMPFYVQ